MAINIFSTRIMLNSILIMKPPQMFLRDTFFPGSQTFGSEFVDLDVKKGKRRLAPFVRPTEASKLMERIGFVTRKYQPPYTKPKMATTAADILQRPIGQNPYVTVPTPQQRAQQRLGEDLQEMRESVFRLIEKMVAETLRTGIVTIVGDTISETVDFLMDANHIITLAGGDLWTDAASDPIDDVRTWKRLVFQATGFKADVAVLGSTVATAFINHAGVRAILDNRRINNVVEIDRRQDNLPPGAEWIGRVEGVNFFTYDEWYEDTAGAEQPMVPANRILMGATGAQTRSEILFGGIQDDEATVPVETFPTSWKENDPPRRFVMLQSAPLPGFHIPDGVVSIQATA